MGMAGPQPGWYPDPTGAPGQRYWDGNAWTTQADSALASYAGPPGSDPGFLHLLRFLGVGMLLDAAFFLLVGFVWAAFIFDKTGYRKRDVLLLFIPLYGTVVFIISSWRYTARRVYWTPWADRPSAVITGWKRPVAIAGGWVLITLLVVGAAAGPRSSQHKLSASDVAACLSLRGLAPSSDQANELELAVRAGVVAAPSLDLATRIDSLCTGPLAPTPSQ